MPILDGLGAVDVALGKGSRRIACEVSVTTDAEHETGNVQTGDPQIGNTQQRVAQHDAVEQVAEPQHKDAQFSREPDPHRPKEIEREASPRGEEELFGRNPPPAPISRKVLLELRDSLRAFLTLLENE